METHFLIDHIAGMFIVETWQCVHVCVCVYVCVYISCVYVAINDYVPCVRVCGIYSGFLEAWNICLWNLCWNVGKGQ